MRALVLLVLLSATACWKTDWKPCSPLNCSGCCAGGECVTGEAASACGAGGAECTPCTGSCLLGACVAAVADACTPSCDGRACGSDGCGGTCGACAAGETCDATGRCTGCTATSCGGSCGSCAVGEVCSAAGVCVAACAPACTGKQCGADGCGGSCGTCPATQSCSASGQCQCVPSCAGRQCGPDGCGGSCGACATGVCNDSGQCVATCTPSCAGKQCGSDGCGGSCGGCPAGTACDPAGKCQCVPSCMGRQCGPDGCGGACGACSAGQSCTASGQCQCVPACAGRTCGADGCGGSCGACASGSACSSAGTCVSTCMAESDATFCARLQKQCGAVTGLDNCGAPRTASCGSCPSGQSCIANACIGPQRLVFTTSWQVLPGTGATTVEFRCAGTVTTTSTGGTRCFRSQGDPVELRISGTTWLLYPGCDGLRSTNCMTSISPSTATYKDYEVNAGGRLLCDAMGWPLANTLADKNPGTYAANVAVVQTGPAVIGTAQGLKNYGTYVNCEP